MPSSRSADRPSTRVRRALGALALALVAGAAGAGPAGAAPLPTAPVGPARVTVATPSGWTVEEHGPAKGQDRLTQIVVRRPGGDVDALLYPEQDAGDFCDATADSYHCLPLRAAFTGDLAMGKDGLVVTDQDADGIPEVAIGLFTGGAHCCVIDVGWWRDAAGTWHHDATNGGSAGGDRTDAPGRLRIADPAFEGLDWAYVFYTPYFTWSRLIPGKGWVDATTRADHLREIQRLNGRVRRYAHDRDAKKLIEAVRAVRIAHRFALGQTQQVASERATYRRKYGRRALKDLDQALKGVARVA
ncbi:hypothetical protein AB0L40_05850 [Patulibacter sp. NPDC049589]|uniref:hypothetical protein n=1 Tax=Patulibacter sp. NPDC049589 TaxID=3154731 RepID=UPI003424DE70